ncbi:MAG: LAGLIDADG family homing endonuclease [Gammaproteobacteria bacterium]
MQTGGSLKLIDLNDLRECDAAYLAGLIDADGTVTLTRKHLGATRHAAVTISNTNRKLLEFVAETVGAGKITSKRAVRKSHSSSFVFSIYNRQALDLLRAIHPYLHTYKARRAELILSDYLQLTPRSGKYGKESKLARRNFEKAVLGIKPNGVGRHSES